MTIQSLTEAAYSNIKTSPEFARKYLEFLLKSGVQFVTPQARPIDLAKLTDEQAQEVAIAMARKYLET